MIPLGPMGVHGALMVGGELNREDDGNGGSGAADPDYAVTTATMLIKKKKERVKGGAPKEKKPDRAIPAHDLARVKHNRAIDEEIRKASGRRANFLKGHLGVMQGFITPQAEAMILRQAESYVMP